MTVRTPDPNPGWLHETELTAARARLPMVYVEALPVRLDSHGRVVEVGLLYRADTSGTFRYSFVSGRVQYMQPVRDALMMHLEKDLGPLAMPQLPMTLTPFTVAEYFPYGSTSGLTDERQHAVALCYVVPVRGDTQPREDALQVAWLTPDEALSADVQNEFEGGRAQLVTQAMAWANWGI
ncbi:MAG: DUF4916 domain-containing protein [Yaniella sp.]|uniref:DUF4916 domain-containing protein n=1 Tax=Yaniella sp. TaxID=2773929 RepID=UPI0026491E49|nr:DUF4916 domain-containing protein [Yaniella sp.]MDN6358254.1 NUDIX hydrolase family protein [Yaniella sp.]